MWKAMRHFIWTALVATHSYAQVTVTATGTILNDDSSGGAGTIFNCGAGGTAFTLNNGATSTACVVGGFSFGNDRPNGFNVTGAAHAVTGGAAIIGDGGNGGHVGIGMMYGTAVNVQKFTVSWTFVPNGKNMTIALTNATNNIFGFNGRNFSAGAGCEAGFYQAADSDTPPFTVALELSGDSPTLVSDVNTFTHSNVQFYTYRQNPCIPKFANSWTSQIPPETNPDKLSTAPVTLNSPVGTAYATTNHNYSGQIDYSNVTGNLTLNLYDITAGDSCPGANCYSHTWTGVNIPSLVGANTAFVGITAGCNLDCPQNVKINSFKYVVN